MVNIQTNETKEVGFYNTGEARYGMTNFLTHENWSEDPHLATLPKPTFPRDPQTGNECLIVVDGKGYSSVEHYFQSQKFEDPALQDKIRETARPGDVFRTARGMNDDKRSNWEEPTQNGLIFKEEAMLKGLCAKYTIPELAEQLKNTGNEYIAEHSTDDDYWGSRNTKEKGPGQNRLGLMLTEVRKALRDTEHIQDPQARQAAMFAQVAETLRRFPPDVSLPAQDRHEEPEYKQAYLIANPNRSMSATNQASPQEVTAEGLHRMHFWNHLEAMEQKPSLSGSEDRLLRKTRETLAGIEKAFTENPDADKQAILNQQVDNLWKNFRETFQKDIATEFHIDGSQIDQTPFHIDGQENPQEGYEALLKELKERYNFQEEKKNGVWSFYNGDDPTKLEFSFDPKKGKFKATSNDPKVIEDMVRLAGHKSGKITITSGTEEFKYVAWMEARLQGIEVEGFKPQEKHLAALRKEAIKRGVDIPAEAQTPEDKNAVKFDQNNSLSFTAGKQAHEPRVEPVLHFDAQSSTYRVEGTQSEAMKELIQNANKDLEDIREIHGNSPALMEKYLLERRQVIEKTFDDQRKLDKLLSMDVKELERNGKIKSATDGELVFAKVVKRNDDGTAIIRLIGSQQVEPKLRLLNPRQAQGLAINSVIREISPNGQSAGRGQSDEETKQHTLATKSKAPKIH